MSDCAAAGSPIDPVIERMTRIAAELPETDGVACFNDLYLAVTRAVAAEATGNGFEDPTFLSGLDVAFYIAGKLGLPEPDSGLGIGSFRAPHMPMPEATVNEDNRAANHRPLETAATASGQIARKVPAR